jgi:hypothetical protein
MGVAGVVVAVPELVPGTRARSSPSFLSLVSSSRVVGKILCTHTISSSTRTGDYACIRRIILEDVDPDSSGPTTYALITSLAGPTMPERVFGEGVVVFYILGGPGAGE